MTWNARRVTTEPIERALRCPRLLAPPFISGRPSAAAAAEESRGPLARSGLPTHGITPVTDALRMSEVAFVTTTIPNLLGALHVVYRYLLPTNGTLLAVESNACTVESDAALQRPLVLRGIDAVATAGPLVSRGVMLTPSLLLLIVCLIKLTLVGTAPP